MRRWLIIVSVLGACDDPLAPVEPAVTWHADIAPLMARHCGGCHAPGGMGPMALDSYAAAVHHGPLALGAIESGVMPPWMPAADCQPLSDARRLSADEKGLYRAWVEDGMPEGDARDARAAPISGFVADETHAVAVSYLPDAAGEDDYHCFVLDRVFAADTYVVGAHVEPGSGQVHHVLVYAINPAQLAEVTARDAADPGPGYRCFAQPIATGFAGQEAFIEYLAGGPLPNFDFPNQLGGWVPGTAPRVLPEGQAYRVQAGSKLVVQVHYSLQGEPQRDDTRLALKTRPGVPKELVRTRPLAVLDLDIAAGASDVVHTRAFPYYGAAPLELVGGMAHMHLLGSAFEASLERADAAACLLRIPSWDFHWQESYRFAAPITVRDGERIAVTCEYDNSARHQAPGPDGVMPAPRHVTWGEGTRDEMCIFYYSSTQPFEPLAPPPATACAPAAGCVAGCARDGAASLDCLLACPSASVDCQLCGVRATLGCSDFSCLGGLVEQRECLVTCLEASLMLGTNLGRCLAAECRVGYEAALQCLDSTLPSCRAELGACGIDFGGP